MLVIQPHRECSMRSLASVCLLSALVLAACGGGSDPPPPPPMSSTISPGSGTLSLPENGSGTLDFAVTVTNPRSSMVAVVDFDQPVLQQVGAIDTSVSGKYAVHLSTTPGLASGAYSGNVRLRLCTDASCATVLSGGTQTFAYQVSVALDDWSTFQRNAAHTGYLNAQFDPAKFTLLWTWTRPAGDPEPIGGINAVATGGGHVYVTKDIYFGQGAVYALNESDGSVAWTYALGQMASEGPAAYAGGDVIVPSTSPGEQCVAWAIDATTGLYKYQMLTGCQWSSYFAPTISGGSVLQTSQAGYVYSFSQLDGSPQWSMSAGAYDQSTPAADASYVYQYGTAGAAALSVFDKVSGALVTTLSDPFAPGSSGYSLFSAPLVTTAGKVLSFSGGGFSGRAASSSEQYESRVLVNYDITTRAYAWRSANSYFTHPAAANGVIYAARNAPSSLDALSESDGHILWSWAPPAGESFHRNIVVTRNLAFVSTDAHVYAIDLGTHQQVWQIAQSGMLAISGSGILYIATGSTLSDGRLIAIKLQ